MSVEVDGVGVGFCTKTIGGYVGDGAAAQVDGHIIKSVEEVGKCFADHKVTHLKHPEPRNS